MTRAVPLLAGVVATLAVTCGALADETAEVSAKVSASAADRQSERVAERLFAGEPRGPHQTGTIEELWIDQQRGEPTTSDPSDPRRLMVQIWYPAVFEGDPARAPYVLHRELYSKRNWLGRTQRVRTNSVLDATVAAQPGGFPVLLYNPGAGYPHFSATFQTEFLASHGYVVVAIGHTGLTGIERFPDGYVYRPDRNSHALSEAERRTLSELERFQLQVQRFSELMPLHVEDIRFVLNRLQSMSTTPGHRFHQRLDLERVGSLGWSLGGALSLQASRDEPRIKAAVNLDGWLFTDVPGTGTRRPILQMHGDEERITRSQTLDAAEREVAVVADALTWRLYTRSDADWYDLTLPRTTHMHFSDLPLFAPGETQLIHPRLAHEIINRYTLEFFDKYLRDRADTPLLTAQQSYPDVVLLQKAPQKTSQKTP